jgi:hypothetical protein
MPPDRWSQYERGDRVCLDLSGDMLLRRHFPGLVRRHIKLGKPVPIIQPLLPVIHLQSWATLAYKPAITF